MKVTPTAKKSGFGYKPALKYPAGSARKTEILEQSSERAAKYIDGERISGDRYAVGNIYPTKPEAIAAADAIIAERLAASIVHRDKNIAIAGKSNKWDDANVALYGG